MRGWSSLELGVSVDCLVALPLGSGGRPLMKVVTSTSSSLVLFFLGCLCLMNVGSESG